MAVATSKTKEVKSAIKQSKKSPLLVLEFLGPKCPKILVIDNIRGKIVYEINTKGEHGIPRKTRVLSFIANVNT